MFQHHIEENLYKNEDCSTTFYWSHSVGQLTYFASSRNLLDEDQENLHKITVDAKNNLITIEWDEEVKLKYGHLVYVTGCGSTIYNVLDEVVEVSQKTLLPVKLTFNGTDVTITPEKTANEAYSEWYHKREVK